MFFISRPKAVVDHYTDEGVSGGKPAFRRPQMARLLEDVKEGKIDIILLSDIAVLPIRSKMLLMVFSGTPRLRIFSFCSSVSWRPIILSYIVKYTGNIGKLANCY